MLTRAEKEEVVRGIRREYSEKAATGGGVVFGDYRGLTVAEMTELRNRLREKAVKIRVLKNTLVRRALAEEGIEGLDELTAGPTIVAFSPDEVSAAKAMVEFAKGGAKGSATAAFRLKGGVIGGEVLSEKEINELALLPGREEVFAKLLALLQAPAVHLLRLINEPAGRMVRLIQEAKKAE